MILPTCNMQMILTLALAASVWDRCVVMLSMSGICNCIYILQSKQSPEMLVLGMTCRDVTGEVWHADEVLAAQLLSTQLLFPRSAGNHSGDGDSDGSGRWSTAGCWSVVGKLETFSSQTRAHQPRPSTALHWWGLSMTLNNVS